MWEFPLYKIDQPIDWQSVETNYDWFREMKGVPQDPIWHAEGDVMIHTKMVVEEVIQLPEFKELTAQEKHILVTAALMHDIEKRSTTTTEVIQNKTRIVSPRHAKKGEFTTRTILYKDLKTPFYIREQIAKLVRLHGLPLWAIEKREPQKEVIKASLQVDTKLLTMLAKADVLGRITNDKEDILMRIELFKELCIENQCFGKSKQFKSNYGRFLYLNKPHISTDYEPYEDLEFTVYVMCALPGSGKDTYIQQHFDLPVLSLDDIRREHKISPTDKKNNGRVVQMGKEKAREWMRKKESFIYNATNITADMRGSWISLFKEYNAKIHLVYIEVPYKKLLKQNKDREYQVPEEVIQKLIGKLEIPNEQESHDITYVIQD